ncbi:MAG: hypothetical protein JST36_03335 [Bacteroidetes bacterium]|nr:hypothetical protein [Bacteroidota bacterium]
MKLRLYSLFVLLVFACQALPIATFGKLCLKQKTTVASSTASILDDLPPDEVKVKKHDFRRLSHHDSDEMLAIAAKMDSQIRQHSAERLPKDCFIEIDSPPPNIL